MDACGVAVSEILGKLFLWPFDKDAVLLHAQTPETDANYFCSK